MLGRSIDVICQQTPQMREQSRTAARAGKVFAYRYKVIRSCKSTTGGTLQCQISRQGCYRAVLCIFDFRFTLYTAHKLRTVHQSRRRILANTLSKTRSRSRTQISLHSCTLHFVLPINTIHGPQAQSYTTIAAKNTSKDTIKDSIKKQDSDFILLHSWCCHQ